MQHIDVIMPCGTKNDRLKSITQVALQSLSISEDPNKVKFHPVVVESHPDVLGFDYKQAEKVIKPEGDFGYHRYLNIGVAHTDSPYICLINNDVYFYKGWAKALIQEFEQDPELMSASPVTMKEHNHRAEIGQGGIWYGSEKNVHLKGWCIFVRRELFNKIGPLDEQFRFWGCDLDYCQILDKYRIKHALITDSIIDHRGCSSWRGHPESDNEPYLWRDNLKYWIKWRKQTLEAKNTHDRVEVLNWLIHRYGYKTYLEIGTSCDWCLAQVKAENKTGVDPNPQWHGAENSHVFYYKTSDQFFELNQRQYDLIFIDGLHEKDQVYRDLTNAQKILSPGGAIVVHDTLPPNEDYQASTRCGETWKGVVSYRYDNPELHVATLPEEFGLTIFKQNLETREEQPFMPPRPDELDWDFFIRNKASLLNCVSWTKFTLKERLKHY